MIGSAHEVISAIEEYYEGDMYMTLSYLTYLYQMTRGRLYLFRVQEICHERCLCPNCFSDLSIIEGYDHFVEYCGVDVREVICDMKCNNCDYTND